MNLIKTLVLAFIIVAVVSADLCIENFETGDKNQTSLGEGMGEYAGYWYAFDDNAEGGESVISTDSIENIVSDDPEFENTVKKGYGTDNSMGLHVVMELNSTPTFEYPYAGIAFPFTQDSAYHDLCGMMELSFDARGGGIIQFGIITDSLTKMSNEDSTKYDYRHMGHNVSLDNDWSSYFIVPSDITQPSWYPSISWYNVCNKSNGVLICSSPNLLDGDIVELWIDNIMYKGENPDGWESVAQTCQNSGIKINGSGHDMKNAVKFTCDNYTNELKLYFPDLKNSNISLSIYNLKGVLIKEISNINDNVYTLGTENIPNGIYLFKIKLQGKTHLTTKKISINK